MRAVAGVYTAAPTTAESQSAQAGGSGGTAGTVAGSRGESAHRTGRSASLSARARQLTPQANEREGTWRRKAPGLGWRRVQFSGCAIAAPALLASRAVGDDRRRAAPPRGSLRRPGSPTGAPGIGVAQRRRAPAALGQDDPPRKSFYYGFRNPSLASKSPALRPRTTSASTSSTRAGEIVADLLPQRRRPERDRCGSAGTGRPRKRPSRAATAATASGSAPRAAGAASPAARAASAEPPSLSFAFYGYAFPILGPHDFGVRRRPLRRPPLRPHPPGPGRDGDCGLPLVAARGGRSSTPATRATPATTS